jgi:gamma-tubulin complex component 3
MVHFIRQLQAFYQLEVIECSWQAFEELVNKNTNGLDGLMEAHKEYLGRLVSRILLVNPRSRSEVSLFFFPSLSVQSAVSMGERMELSSRK